MFRHAKTLQARLALYHLVVFGLAQAALWITVDVVRSNQLRQGFDQQLLERAQIIARELHDLTLDSLPSEISSVEIKELVNPRLESRFPTSVEVAGTVVIRSSVLEGLELPADLSAHGRGARFTTLDGPVAELVFGHSSALRIVVLNGQTGDHIPFSVQVAGNLAPIENTIASTRMLLLVFIATTLAISLGTSWLLVVRSLRPVRRVVYEASRIGVNDLSRRIRGRETRDEIGQMVRVINRMLERLEVQFKHQQQFISNTAHELKTPLAILLGEAQDLEQLGSASADENTACKEFAATVAEESRRLLGIVDSFLLLARARSAGRPPVRQPVQVDELIVEAARAHEDAAKTAGVRVVPRLELRDENPEPVVIGDRDLLASMIDNLLGNAIRHSPEGGVVCVTLESSTKEIVVGVRDQGPGIPEKHLDRIFEPFHQIPSDSQKTGKLGVGLAIASAVAELHGGSIGVHNHKEGGAQFTVHLPVGNAQEG